MFRESYVCSTRRELAPRAHEAFAIQAEGQLYSCLSCIPEPLPAYTLVVGAGPRGMQRLLSAQKVRTFSSDDDDDDDDKEDDRGRRPSIPTSFHASQRSRRCPTNPK
eukprot:4465095-Pyramimonas_sp.AAC.2